MARICLTGIIFLFLFSTLKSGIAQESDSSAEKRPTIGLVLSGGGAKGIAHIGILKAMEQEGLRPDFITGTSMGSIIGGLYAIGYSADQLDSIIRSVNWDLVLSNNIPLNYIAYEEKEQYNRYLVELQLEDKKLKLPSGLIEGQILSEELTRFTWPAHRYESFDEFPIPFRCVATDVSTGLPIVFKEGSLAKAIRASMAIPTAFTAVDLDSTLAVDGGVVENFPVDEVLAMGADIVIGVSVGDGMIRAKDLDGMTGILFQVSMIPSLSKMEKQVEQCDIYIRPDLKNYGTASFSNYAEILELGYLAGEQNREQFRELAKNLGIQAKPVQKLPVSNINYRIDEIIVTGNKLVDRKLILSKLDVAPGDHVKPGVIEDGIRSVFGTTFFSKVTYELEQKSDQEGYLLRIQCIEKNPVVIKGSVHYDNTFNAGIVLNLTLRNLLGRSSRTILMGDISNNPKFRADYLKYFGQNERMALNFKYQFLNEQVPTYNEGSLEDIDINVEQRFDLGIIRTQSLKNSFYLGASYQFTDQKSKFNTIIPEGIKRGAFNFGILDMLYEANSLNDRNYPTSGEEISVLGEFYFANYYRIVFEKDVDTIYIPLEGNGIIVEFPLTEDQLNDMIVKPQTPDAYAMARFMYRQFISLGDNFQVIPSVSTGLTFANDSAAIFYEYRMGGFQRVKFTDVPFVGLNFAEKDYENFLIGGLFFQNVIWKSIYFKYGANLILPYDYVALNNLDSFSAETLWKKNSMLGYGLELTYQSFLGPINLGVGNNTRDGRFRFYFSIGYSFNFSD